METINFNWCTDIAARAHYEMANYPLSRQIFQSLIKSEPYSLQSMECYSTLLWHLGDAPALSALTQRLMSIDREAPQTWIAAGNCFSLQKNHDEAMRCFRRATQVDPSCAYAWTLCGYEAIEMEEHDRAMAFYRSAIRTDARHYNAWYGMGLVYLKTGKTKYSEHHFRRAAEINPTSPVLLCCIGMVSPASMLSFCLQLTGRFWSKSKTSRKHCGSTIKRANMLRTAPCRPTGASARWSLWIVST
jgi:anaphase-promoting complex subunit 3